MIARPLLALALALSACGPSVPTERYLVTDASGVQAVVADVETVLVREINLPDYANREEISLQDESGAVLFIPGTLWADTPARALTKLLASRLSSALPGSKVAAEPWPLTDRPELRVEVQVDQLLGAQSGTLLFTGQYFVVAGDFGDVAIARNFRFVEEFDPTSVGSLGQAHGAAVSALAREVAAVISGVPGSALGG
ncbi:MAG: PqiC family protein [Pseudomonadota bacterium]